MNDSKNTGLTWLNHYPIVNADHVHTLDTMAAIAEFLHKMPRHEAEAKAHEDYVKDQVAEAAAHHLVNMQAAHGAGDRELAKKHGVMYALALKQLGHEIVGPVPPEVESKVKQRQPSTRFKAHAADIFSVPEQKDEEPVQKAEGAPGTYWEGVPCMYETAEECPDIDCTHNTTKKSEAKLSIRRPNGQFGHTKQDKICVCGATFEKHQVGYPHKAKGCKGFKPDGRRNK